jgi:hypothetical protein
MPWAPAGPRMRWRATEDRLRAIVRDNKAALLGPQLEERGSISRGRLRNLDLRHQVLNGGDRTPKGRRHSGFPGNGSYTQPRRPQN